MTWATPGIARSCGRSTKSAISRISIGDAASLGDGDQHDLAHDRRDRAHLRRSFRAGAGLAPAPDAPRPVGDCGNVGAPVEFDIDDRQADARHRANPRHARHSIHDAFDRKGDKLLDLLRREPLGFGHQRHDRPIEVRKNVDGDAREHERAVGNQDQRGGEHDQTVTQARRDETIEHGRLPIESG